MLGLVVADLLRKAWMSRASRVGGLRITSCGLRELDALIGGGVPVSRGSDNMMAGFAKCVLFMGGMGVRM